jgi:hypothetical protein
VVVYAVIIELVLNPPHAPRRHALLLSHERGARSHLHSIVHVADDKDANALDLQRGLEHDLHLLHNTDHLVGATRVGALSAAQRADARRLEQRRFLCGGVRHREQRFHTLRVPESEIEIG